MKEKTLQEEYAELEEVVNVIRSLPFKEYIIDSFKEEIAKLKRERYPETIQEAWRQGGMFDGLDHLSELLKNIESDFKNKKTELESLK